LTVSGEQFADIMAGGAALLGIDMPAGALALFDAYRAFLEKRRASVNLTAITGAADTARLHFLDSAALLNATPFAGLRVIDVGSGAGFPGVPLKIAEPSIDLTLLESTGKRVAFLSELCAALGIDAATVHARAEEASRFPEMRERYDIAVSRAVARLNVLCELCLPFVRCGGVFIAMKGIDSNIELEEAHGAITALGAALECCHEYDIPGSDVTRRAVIIRKTSETPDRYPRRFARIQKAPL